MTGHTMVALFCLCLAVGGCAENAEDTYARNMRYAYVTPWTHLSAADRREIVRLASAATGKNSRYLQLYAEFSGDFGLHQYS